jgi:resuscitation-promoting factor RpfB
MIKKKAFKPYIKRLDKHPYIIPVTTFLVLFFLTIAAFVGINSRTAPPSDSRVVELSVDGERRSIPTRAETVGDFLKRAEITLEQFDIVEPSAEAPIDDEKFHINVYRARPVTIVDADGAKTFAYSAATTPRSVAKQAGVDVFPEDKVESTVPDNFLKEGVLGEKVVIDRSTPANINLYGIHVAVRTHTKTVRELLAEKNVHISGSDTVKPSLDTPITPQVQIFITRSGTQLTTTTEEIPMPTEVINDPKLSFGVQAVRQQGSPGKRVVTYEILLKNGKEIGRKKIQEVVSVAPVKQITARGTAVYIPKNKVEIMRAAGISSGDYPYVDYIISHESGWCPTKAQGQIGFCPAFPSEPIPTGSGYGLGQATPGNKMAPFGADWKTNPVTQLRWATSYANSRHGGWGGAYNFWLANTWW